MKIQKLIILFLLLQFTSCTDKFAELPKEVGQYFKESLNNPSSFELIEISSSQLIYGEYELYVGGKPKEISIEDYIKKQSDFKLIQKQILDDKESFPILHEVSYRAKNGFDALILNSKYCVTLPDGTFIGCFDNYEDYSKGICEKILKPKIEHLF